MRRPVIAPEGEPLECGEIFTRIADAMGMIPPLPDSLVQAAEGDRAIFAGELMKAAHADPGLFKVMPFVLAKTLGRKMGSAHLAGLWGLLFAAPGKLRKAAAAAGLDPDGEKLFQAILDHPQGLWLGKLDETANMADIRTPSGRIELFIPEMDAWMAALTPEREAAALQPDPAFPLILMAGRHDRTNANTLMRDPSWNHGRRTGTLTMHADDAADLGLVDGQRVRVATAAGEETVELEIRPNARPGQVILPHGFGLVHGGEKTGANVNRLTQSSHRDGFAATPLHRYVPAGSRRPERGPDGSTLFFNGFPVGKRAMPATKTHKTTKGEKKR